ncbi:hypothetical protein, partial [Streptomyces colonosanans]|uniref:hypothetical protein n=1 Tax=Streptomyces colonosanans TaxID=1428652 RepID=UPI000D1A2AB5
MYGHGAEPPTRTSGTVISLRVLFAVAGFLSCGLLASIPLFRVAVLRGRPGDWLLAWLSLPLSIVGFAVVGTLPEGDLRSDIALCLLLLLGAFSTAYFLVFDIRHHRTMSSPFGPLPSQTTGAVPPGYTTPVPPGYTTPVPPQPGYGYPPAQPYAVTQPTPAPPTPYAPAPPPAQPQLQPHSQPQPQPQP